MHWTNFGIEFGFGWLFMILFWGLVIVGIYYLIKLLAGTSGKTEEKETAEEILKKRFAKGEINKEKFENTLNILKQT